MKGVLDVVVAAYVTLAAGINTYLAVRFWRGIFR